MTDAERKAQEAERLLSEPLLNEALDGIEREAYEKLLAEPDVARMVEHRNQINAIRALRAHLRTQVTLGAQSARKTPSVA